MPGIKNINGLNANQLNSMNMMHKLFKVDQLSRRKRVMLEQSLGVFFNATGGKIDTRHLSGLSDGLMKLIGINTCEKLEVTKEQIEKTFINNDLVVKEDL